MRVEWAESGTAGDVMFIVHAETREERLVLHLFKKQVDQHRPFIHGWAYQHGGIGPSCFSLGSIRIGSKAHTEPILAPEALGA